MIYIWPLKHNQIYIAKLADEFFIAMYDIMGERAHGGHKIYMRNVINK